MLLDSNIIIYLTDPENSALQEYVSGQTVGASIISLVEVLGFHGITDADKSTFEEFFEICTVHFLSAEIAERAVRLRQTRKIGLGDSIVAATALEQGLPLATNNIKDFQWIESLELIDPLTA
ncbi:MAG: type II toxin-antitoxin system VapC family toxin [Chloracidobacterium sp.]|nr:type II toxin-antitoxin system VapC family toxin [Chloracidobacterium sp.]